MGVCFLILSNMDSWEFSKSADSASFLLDSKFICLSFSLFYTILCTISSEQRPSLPYFAWKAQLNSSVHDLQVLPSTQRCNTIQPDGLALVTKALFPPVSTSTLLTSFEGLNRSPFSISADILFIMMHVFSKMIDAVCHSFHFLSSPYQNHLQHPHFHQLSLQGNPGFF